MGKDTHTGKMVSLKTPQAPKRDYEVLMAAVHEMSVVEGLHHENVLKLEELVLSPDFSVGDERFTGSVYLVFEFMQHDLMGILSRRKKFEIPEIKCIMSQILTGLEYCHAKGIVHRNIKGANILINNHGIVKISDFGLATQYSGNQLGPCEGFEGAVDGLVTLNYRPPEVLLGDTTYRPAIDMWSVGCVFAELLHDLHNPLFDGSDTKQQLDSIFNICGTYDEHDLPGVLELPLYKENKPPKPIRREIRKHFPRYVDGLALDLIDRMLVLNPDKRIGAQEALRHPYFGSDPIPCAPRSLRSTLIHSTKERALHLSKELSVAGFEIKRLENRLLFLNYCNRSILRSQVPPDMEFREKVAGCARELERIKMSQELVKLVKECVLMGARPPHV